jgi:hypothetical protein
VVLCCKREKHETEDLINNFSSAEQNLWLLSPDN